MTKLNLPVIILQPVWQYSVCLSECPVGWYLFMRELVASSVFYYGGKIWIDRNNEDIWLFYISSWGRKVILQISLMRQFHLFLPNCPVRELLHMFFWHRNKKCSECELCSFSINWQEAIFLPARKYRSIYLHMGKKYAVCLSVNLTSYTLHCDSTATHRVFWASFLTLLTDFTQ